jgi:hypothetical protein
MSTDWMKTVPQGIAKASSSTMKRNPPGWQPSNRKLGFYTAKRTRTPADMVVVPASMQNMVPPPPPKYYDPTGRKLQTSPSAFAINVDSVVSNPLRRTTKAGRRHRNRHKKTRRNRKLL